MSSAGPSRPRVVTLTADQLLGTSLTPARPHSKHKSSSTPRVLTIEDLLGPGLTVARPASRPAPRPAPRPPPRPSSSRSAGSSSTRSAPNPRLVRVTADEVLRTGIPVRTLQAVKARSQVLSAEDLLAATSARPSAARDAQARGRAATAGSSSQSTTTSGSSSRTGTAASANAGRSAGSSSTGASHGTRPGGQRANRENEASGSSSQSRTRNGQPRRSTSLGSMRTLPIYTQEPGDSETVIDRGATELEDDDEIPITVMSPVEENEPNGGTSASAGPTSSPDSPSQTEGATFIRQLSPVDATVPRASSLPNDPPLPPWTSIYADAAPSYEAAMSTPNLHVYRGSPENVPLPTSPQLSPVSPSAHEAGISPTSPSPAYVHTVSALVSLSPSSSARDSTSPPTVPSPSSTSPRPTVRVVTPRMPGTSISPGARSPASPSSSPGERSDGAETPRRRFGFMSTLFHSRSSSRLRSRSHSHSSAQAPSTSTSPRRVASPELVAPAPTRPFHRFSQSASGSMLDLTSRSRANN